MRFYITQNALTLGIEEVDAVIFDKDSIKTTDGKDKFYCGSDWHTTRLSAVKRAESMRWERLNKLQNEVQRLMALRYDG